jgi:hypothetical protein
MTPAIIATALVTCAAAALAWVLCRAAGRRDDYQPIEHEPPVRTLFWGGNIEDGRRLGE